VNPQLLALVGTHYTDKLGELFEARRFPFDWNLDVRKALLGD
jgi:hypothetical protein